MGNENDNSGGEGGSWRDSLPEQLRDAPFFKNAENIERVMVDLKDAAGHMGNSIRVPGPDATAEVIAAFQAKAIERLPGMMPTPNVDDDEVMAALYAKLGRPDAAEAYKVPDMEGMDWDDHDLASLKLRAHQAGLSQKQFTGFLNSMGTEFQEAQGKTTLAQKEEMQILGGEWGAAFDTKKNAIAQMLNGNAGAPKELIASLQAGTLPAETMRWLDNMASAIGGEGGNAGDDRGAGQGVMTPVEAKAQIGEVLADPDYFNARSPRQALLKEKMMTLQLAAHPPQAAKPGYRIT